MCRRVSRRRRRLRSSGGGYRLCILVSMQKSSELITIEHPLILFTFSLVYELVFMDVYKYSHRSEL